MTVLAEALALAALVVVPLAQVPLVAYLSRYVALDGDADRPDPRDGYVTYGTRGARPDDARPEGTKPGTGVDERSCPACGRTVPDAFDYCGGCATLVDDGRRGGGRR